MDLMYELRKLERLVRENDCKLAQCESKLEVHSEIIMKISDLPKIISELRLFSQDFSKKMELAVEKQVVNAKEIDYMMTELYNLSKKLGNIDETLDKISRIDG